MLTVGLLLATGAIAVSRIATGTDTEEAMVMQVASEALPNLPGQRMTAVLVAYGPGGKSMAHRHAGSVLAYVLEGAIRSGINDEEPKVYKAGESFFEPPGSTHSVSENASETEPARLLAIIVAPEGEKLTVPAN